MWPRASWHSIGLVLKGRFWLYADEIRGLPARPPLPRTDASNSRCAYSHRLCRLHPQWLSLFLRMTRGRLSESRGYRF